MTDRKDIHKAVRNYLFNDLGLNRGEARQLLIDALDTTLSLPECSPEELKRIIRAEIAEHIEKGFKKERWYGAMTFQAVVKEIVKEVVREKLKNLAIDVNVETK